MQYANSWEWKPAGEGQWALYRDGRQVGNWWEDGRYFPLRGDTWGPEAPCPTTPPVPSKKKLEPNYGVVVEKIDHTTNPENRINGVLVPKRQAIDAIENGIPDDKGLLRLTVIGTKEEGERIRKDLETSPELAPWKGKLLVQTYQPGEWTVSQSGFVTTGSPVVYLQKPNGEVLHRQDDYADGPKGLAKALGKVEAVRKPQPNYDPNKDPDLRQDAPPPSPFHAGSGLPAIAYIGFTIGLMYFFRRPEQAA